MMDIKKIKQSIRLIQSVLMQEPMPPQDIVDNTLNSYKILNILKQELQKAPKQQINYNRTVTLINPNNGPYYLSYSDILFKTPLHDLSPQQVKKLLAWYSEQVLIKFISNIAQFRGNVIRVSQLNTNFNYQKATQYIKIRDKQFYVELHFSKPFTNNQRVNDNVTIAYVSLKQEKS